MIFTGSKKYVVFFLLYTIANLFLLLNIDGINWDDWSIYRQPLDTLVFSFQQVSGISAYALLHHFLQSIGNGIYSYRVFTFILYFISGVLMYKILESTRSFTSKDLFFITLLFLVAPLNSARVALIDIPYAFDYVLFFGAFYMLNVYLNLYRIWVIRIFVLFSFFASFIVNSFLVFYAIPLMYIFYMTMNQEQPIVVNIKVFMAKNIDFIMLPILFFVIKSIYLKPQGAYQEYNALELKSLLMAPIYSMYSFFTSFITPLYLSLSVLPYVAIVIVFVVWHYKPKMDEVAQTQSAGYYRWLMGLGAIFFILAVFPYCAVGKIPTSFEFNSRNQLLVPLGFALIFYSGLQLIAERKKISQLCRDFFLIGFIILFIGRSMIDQYRYNVDYIYQVAIIENFKASKVIQEHTTFICKNNLTDALAGDRRIRYYEYNGYLKKAFGNDQRLMVDKISEINTFAKQRNLKQYNFSSWVYQHPYQVTIYKTSELNGKLSFMIKAFYFRLSDNLKFRELVKNLVVIDVREIEK